MTPAEARPVWLILAGLSALCLLASVGILLATGGRFRQAPPEVQEYVHRGLAGCVIISSTLLVFCAAAWRWWP
jgi:hypothetical protein